MRRNAIGFSSPGKWFKLWLWLWLGQPMMTFWCKFGVDRYHKDLIRHAELSSQELSEAIILETLRERLSFVRIRS